MYRVITRKHDIAKAQKVFERHLRSGKKMRRVVGYQGYSDERDIYWHEKYGYWVTLDNLKSRYWTVFGVENPEEVRSLSITVEINSPVNKTNRRVQGVFLKDDKGAVSLGHRGCVNQVKKGEFRKRFREGQNGEWVRVVDDDRESEILRLYPLDDRGILENLSSFINEVHRIKAEDQNAAGTTSVNPPPGRDSYNMENEQETEFSPSQDPIVARKRHAKVTNALKKQLENRFPDAAITNRPYDILLAGRKKSTDVLFEIKSGADSQSVHTLVGQLLVYEARIGRAVKKVAVLPTPLPKEFEKIWPRLRIELVTFGLVEGKPPKFYGLDDVLNM